ncbi:PP2C family protein-serine/threonine phosphatase [Streptomyces sp. NPDC001914]|uniref:PP2C family protein-serine/threonine phosphatase n=1 Tax=Streptomyces sp. NPDC001914 TaxID=3364623 RepID=UPI003681E621
MTAALLYGVVVVLQLCTPASVRIPSVLVVVPAVVALAFGPGVIVGSAVLAAGTRWAFFPIDHRLGAAIGTTAVICSIAALGCFVVRLREREAVRLAKVNSVAEAAQRAILRPPPATVGQFHTAARYRAATEYARIGGDFYAATDTAFGVRALIGDVRGKGLDAVATAAAILGSFHEAAHHHPTLRHLADALDTSLRRHLNDTEAFATAFLLEVGHDNCVRTQSCGHPAPLVIRAHDVIDLPAPPGLPLGLRPLGDAALSHHPAAPPSTRLHPGDTVLMYTDGLTEARDDSGAFYPLADRLTAYAHLDRPKTNPGDFLEWVEQDVRAYAGDTPHDDAALLALTWNRKP